MKLTDEELNRIIAKADYDLDRLKDRCHELYEENQELKENLEWWKDKFFGQQTYDDSFRITAQEYNRRIYEAIEILRDLAIDNATACRKALKILQGDDKE